MKHKWNESEKETQGIALIAFKLNFLKRDFMQYYAHWSGDKPR